MPSGKIYKIPRPAASANGHELGVTLVSSGIRGSILGSTVDSRWLFLRALDPRRSLGTKVGWLVTALSLIFAMVGAWWLGNMMRDGLSTQHCRQLALDTEELAAALDQTFTSRLQALQAVATVVGLKFEFDTPRALHFVLDEVQSTHPEFEWMGFTDPKGTVVAATQGLERAPEAASRPWPGAGPEPAWIEDVSPNAGGPAAPNDKSTAPDRKQGQPVLYIATPVRDTRGRAVGTLGARMHWSWLEKHALGLHESLRHQSAPEALVLDSKDEVLIGPPSLRGRRWTGAHIEDVALFESAQLERSSAASGVGTYVPTVSEERITDGQTYLVSRVVPPPGSALRLLGWSVVLIEPQVRAEHRADRLRMHIVWVSVSLGATVALLGTLITYRMTRRLIRLSNSVEAVGAGRLQEIEVPPGADEVTRLGSAFANLLGALRKERGELSALSAELEGRVIARTREVEKLAKETRYAAVVRERLKMARDLHDTLAHSMMAMLAEMRLLKRLFVLNPSALPEELAHAEQVAREGLQQARASITRMRFNAVRDVGLGAALTELLKNHAERTGQSVETNFDPNITGFAEERAEAVYRIAEEALRNVERHARASRIRVALQQIAGGSLELSIYDDGVGFDSDANYAGHFGIVGMIEQAQLIGAELTFRSIPNEGTTVRLVF